MAEEEAVVEEEAVKEEEPYESINSISSFDLNIFTLPPNIVGAPDLRSSIKISDIYSCHLTARHPQQDVGARRESLSHLSP